MFIGILCRLGLLFGAILFLVIMGISMVSCIWLPYWIITGNNLIIDICTLVDKIQDYLDKIEFIHDKM